MGHAAVGAGNHNGIKGQALGAVFIHPVDELRLKLQLGHAGLDNGQRFQKCPVGNFLGLTHPLDLPGLFDAPESVDPRIIGHQSGIEILLQIPELRNGQIVLLKAQGGDAKIRNGFVDTLGIVPRALDIQNLKIPDILLGGLNIPAVGEIPAALFADHRHTLGNIELGTVVTAVAGGQKQAIHFPIQYGQELI